MDGRSASITRIFASIMEPIADCTGEYSTSMWTRLLAWTDRPTDRQIAVNAVALFEDYYYGYFAMI